MKEQEQPQREVLWEGKRIRLATLTHDRIHELREYRNLPKMRRWLNYGKEISEEQQEQWFAGLIGDRSRIVLADEDRAGNFIGLSSGSQWDHDNRSIVTTQIIFPPYWNMGYGRECLGNFTMFLLEKCDIHRAWFLVTPDNISAFKMDLALGFQVEGVQKDALFRDDRYYDCVMMAAIKGEWEYHE